MHAVCQVVTFDVCYMHLFGVKQYCLQNIQ